VPGFATPADLAAAGARHEFAPYEPADPGAAIAHLSYTGGTTGVPKGVLVSQRNVVRNALQFCHWATGSHPALDAHGDLRLDQIGSAADWPVRLSQGVSIAVAPWFHAMGLIGGVVVPALQGTRSLLIGRFDPERFLDTVEREGVTTVSGAPAMLAQLARQQEARPRAVGTVRLVSCGGGPLPPPLADRLADAFGSAVVVQAYGLTEATMAAVGGSTARSGLRSRGSVGAPMPDTEIRLSPPENSGDSDSGEILLRGPQISLGYQGRPDETAALFADGWLRTGDLGRIDEHGHLVVVDRQKDMLIYKGYNVYPAELENLLREIPGVRDAAVVGVPDAEVGDVPVAFAVLDPTTAAEAVTEAVNARVVHYKRIRTVHVVDELPRSAMGKVLKSPLRERAAALEPVRRLEQHRGELAERLGITYREASAERIVATMPVAGNRQPYGLLHGGASVVLAETIGSALAVLATGFTRRAVGLEVSATHHRPARDGVVTATATVAARTGGTATVDVVVRDEAGTRTCTARLTCLLRARD
jgi:long-chain acyl-CoA synthetase